MTPETSSKGTAPEDTAATGGEASAGAPPRDTPVAAHVRRIYLGGRTGGLEVVQTEGRRRLWFRRGDLYLPGAHPMAVLLEPRLAAATDRASLGRDPNLRSLMERIADTISAWHGEVRFLDGERHLPQGLLGPLPTSLVVMYQAQREAEGHETSVAEVEERLGGASVRLRAVRTDAGLLRLAALDQEEMALLQRLASPRTLEDLLGELPEEGIGETLTRLVRLDAVGLLERTPSRQTRSAKGSKSVADRFAERIGQSLKAEPLELEPEAHRRFLADLLARVGELSHYELLELDPEAAPEAIHQAFERLARRVHPSHAAGLGLEGREAALGVLFERATEAYLTLGDPHRRASYDRAYGFTSRPPGEEERREERRDLARRYYLRAQEMAEAEDLAAVVDLLKDAVRHDPRPEYYVLMGRVQARNPNWQRHAAESLEKARQLGERSPDTSLALAQVYERLERPEAAERLYREVLERQPGDSRAEEGLERLRRAADEAGGGSWWRKILGG